MAGGDNLQLKRASELLAESLGGYVKAAALIGKGKSTVGRWCNRNDPDFANIADVREMEANAPLPLVTMALARLAGGAFIELPDPAADPGTLAGMVMELVARLGAVSHQLCLALADGVVEPREADAVLDLLHEHERTGAALRAALTAIRAGTATGAALAVVREAAHG